MAMRGIHSLKHGLQNHGERIVTKSSCAFDHEPGGLKKFAQDPKTENHKVTVLWRTSRNIIANDS
jgi:hypothetical protein